ncbi:MAG: site-2 protease family protein [Promethearchaeia archaeon]
MKIGKIRNIEIKLNISTLFIIALIGYYAATTYYSLSSGHISLLELFLVGIINGIILMFSIFLHELMHSFVAQHYGITVKEIELHLFGGVSRMLEEPRTPKAEFYISGVGPLTSLTIGLASILFNFLPLGFPNFIRFTLFYSGISNIILGLFNLIPAFPMDGGRVLRSILWRKRNNLISATKTASNIGVAFGYFFIGLGFVDIIISGLISGLWLVFIGFYIISAARGAFTQSVYDFKLSNINARQLTRIPRVFIPYNMSLEEAVLRYFMPYSYTYFPVIDGGLIVGIVHINDIRKIPVYMRNRVIIGDIMRPISYFPIVSEEQSGRDIVRVLNEIKEGPQILLVEDENDQLIGFISLEDVLSSLKFI